MYYKKVQLNVGGTYTTLGYYCDLISTYYYYFFFFQNVFIQVNYIASVV